MRLLVLKAAKAMDVLGNKEARIWVSMIKAKVPEQVCNIIDQAMQVHGATGISASGRRCLACTPSSARCAMRTALTRCITTSSRATRCRPTKTATRVRTRIKGDTAGARFIRVHGMSLFDLTGKVALLTGRVQGHGSGMATALAEHGATVVISARKQDQLDAAAAADQRASAQGEAHAVACNVGHKAAACKRWLTRPMSSQGPIDIVDRQCGREPLLTARPQKSRTKRTRRR